MLDVTQTYHSSGCSTGRVTSRRQITQTLPLAVPIHSHTCAPIRVDYSRVLDGQPGPSRRQARTFQLTSAHCCGSVVRNARAVTGHLDSPHLARLATPDGPRTPDLRW